MIGARARWMPGLLGFALCATATAGGETAPARTRFAAAGAAEVPDFQKHVLPAMGRLGCNTRSCHGSFQGQGGFRLSLFGYDFQADHDALMAKDEDRVDAEAPELSLILQKPTEALPHKGGKRMAEGDWAYNLLHRWIVAGAKPVASGAPRFEKIEVTPREITFRRDGEEVGLKVVAHWSDGTVEDVTCLARFQTNDESIAGVDAEGMVTSKGRGDTNVVAFYDNGVAAVPVLRPVSDLVGDQYTEVPARSEVDRLVLGKLRKLGIVPSEVCDDAEFLRRLSLDMTGTLPTPGEARQFLASADPQKRAKKIDELLERPAYAAYWANRLCDTLGNSPRNFQNNPAALLMSRRWFEWIEKRIADNTPYDQMMAGLLVARSREPGEDYEDYVKKEMLYLKEGEAGTEGQRESMPYFWARRNLAQPEEKALAVSYAFLGVRLECAQCHKHPFDQWTQQDFNEFKAFFEPIRYGPGPEARRMIDEVRRELAKKAGKDPANKQAVNGGEVRREVERRLRAGEMAPMEEVQILTRNAGFRAMGRPQRPGVKGAARVPTASVLGGDEVKLTDYADPREPIMAWMRDPENPYFARAMVNRVWAAYFGIGIVNPPDDSNLANPASNPALLDYLSDGFVKHGFNLDWLHKEITTSDTYQRSWRTNETNRNDERNFSRALVRRLPAESLIDAVRQATASAPLLEKMQTDMTLRAIGPASSQSYARGGAGDYAGRLFGRSARDTNCDCSRSDEPNLLQAIYLQNDNELLASLERPDGWVAELSKADRGSKERGSAAPGGVAALRERIAFLESRRAKPAAGENPRLRLARIERQLSILRAELKELEARRPATSAPSESERRGNEELVTEAYLRTLSRTPSEPERAAALEHLASADSGREGLRDLLWALLNTKEFITNH